MKRLTLDEAVGQTLLAKVKIGDYILLRFTAGFVALETHFESYEIYDFTDGEDPLGYLQKFDDVTLDALHVAGFIDGDQKFTAATQRAELHKSYEIRREADLRQQYESLKERFEPKKSDQ